jgi:hypothetical protein
VKGIAFEWLAVLMITFLFYGSAEALSIEYGNSGSLVGVFSGNDSPAGIEQAIETYLGTDFPVTAFAKIDEPANGASGSWVARHRQDQEKANETLIPQPKPKRETGHRPVRKGKTPLPPEAGPFVLGQGGGPTTVAVRRDRKAFPIGMGRMASGLGRRSGSAARG